MVKTVVAVIVGLVLLNTAWLVLKIVILIAAERREYEKYRYKSPYQSPHREAFIIKKMDREQKRIAKIKLKSDKKLSNMSI